MLTEIQLEWPRVSSVAFWLLLMFGSGTTIHRSLAQCSGWPIVPVAFSVGWFGYSLQSLSHVFGERKLMPNPDSRSPTRMSIFSTVINGKTGAVVRNNQSWMLQRVLRDFKYWQPPAVKREVQNLVSEAAELKEPEKEPTGGISKGAPVRKPGFYISIFRTTSGSVAGAPAIDWLFFTGIVFTIVQLLISAVPYILYGQWTVLIVTASGTLLAFLYGSLPQWKKEKWDCRRGANIVALAEGFMADHVIVIVGDENALNLEDLAEGGVAGRRTSLFTRFCLPIFALAWFPILLVTMEIQQNVWYLFAVCVIGWVQNLILADGPRDPSAFGLHLDFVEIVKDVRVVGAFMKLEDKYPTLATNLRPNFYPGRLSDEEWLAWYGTKRNRDEVGPSRL